MPLITAALRTDGVRVAMRIAVLLGCVIAAAAPAADRPVVTIAQGILQGRTSAHGVRSFKGIPYARPPVGNLRWKPPVAAIGWKGVRDASRFGASCIQPRWPAGSLYDDRIISDSTTAAHRA